MKMKEEEPTNFDFGILELYWKIKLKEIIRLQCKIPN
jgi:hypothetical protein